MSTSRTLKWLNQPSARFATRVADLLDSRNVRYTPITTASPFLVELTSEGHNIFGVRTAGAFEVQVPSNLPPTHVVIVSDERGGPPITVTMV